MGKVINGKLLRLFALLFVMQSATTGLRFTATLDAISLGATPMTVGAMLATVSLFPAFFAVSVGRHLDRKGPAGPARTSYLVAALAGLLAFFIDRLGAGVAPLFGACFGVGVAFLLTNTVVQRLTGDLTEPKSRTAAFTALSMVTAACGLMTPVAAGYLIEWKGYGAMYLWSVGAGAALLLLSATPVMTTLFDAGKPREAKREKTKPRVGDLLADRPMRAILAASVFISVAWEVGNLMIPVYCRSVDLSPSEIGWILGTFAAASFCVRLLMPILVKRLGEWGMISGTMLVAGTAFALFPFFETVETLCGVAFLLGLGLGASLPNLMSLIYRLAPQDRIGEAIGLRLMLMNLSKASFPVLMGAFGTLLGPGSALWALTAFLWTGFAGAFAERDRMRRAMDGD